MRWRCWSYRGWLEFHLQNQLDLAGEAGEGLGDRTADGEADAELKPGPFQKAVGAVPEIRGVFQDGCAGKITRFSD